MVYQSGSADDDHMGHLVTDGSELTYWVAKAGGEQWISVDLGETLPLHLLTLQWGANRAASYQIDVSADAHVPVHWKTVYTSAEDKGDVEQISLHDVQARRVRLTGAASGDRGFSVVRLEVWSTERERLAARVRPTVTRDGTLLKDGWTLQSALFAKSPAERIASANSVGENWLPAVVPGTVLTSYRRNGSIPDPWYGNQIAEISDGFFTRNDFWYRNCFVIAPDCKSRRLWLVFQGINWKADVYFNGEKLGIIEGAFIRSRFDITDIAICGGANCVAVLIHQVAHPGAVQHKVLSGSYRNGGILGLDSPTFVSSIGWNWVPTIPGRCIGIWNDVRFETTGEVVLEDPWVSTELPDGARGLADLTVHTEIRNLSKRAQQCTVAVSMENVAFEQKITLQPEETRTLNIDKAAHAALSVANPRLWWPNGYGDPALHTMRVTVHTGLSVSDEENVVFGMRKMDYQIENNVLHILVNGYRILCRGGNWGMDDGMLDCDREGYELRIGMHRDMNLNMIRNWVGMVGRDDFYDVCDRHGMLVWDDFWLANPGDGPDPENHAMFMSNVVDKVRRVRRHPSLALYCGRNEGDPPPDLNEGMRRTTSQLDGTRYYLPASASWLVTGHGPYDNQDPQWYFEHRGGTFHSEQGIVCVPPVESMRAMMPETDLWPINDMWAVHDYQTPRSRLYTERIQHRYGEPEGIEDYCRKAQMVNLESAKAIYESLQSRQGSGQLIWMTQAAWPALICQLYDYYFEQTAAYFGAKLACEPVHILWDSFTDTIKVANNTIAARDRLQAEARIYGLDGRELWRRAVEVSVPATSARECFRLDKPAGLDRMFFVKLRLSGGDGVLSENFYWNPASDCTDLNTLPKINLLVSANVVTDREGNTISAVVSNPSASVAVAVRVKLVRNGTGERVLPAIYEDNYFSLLPGEKRVVKIRYTDRAMVGEKPRLELEGWNIKQSTHRL